MLGLTHPIQKPLPLKTTIIVAKTAYESTIVGFVFSVFFSPLYQILGKNRKEEDVATCKTSNSSDQTTQSNIKCSTTPISKDETNAITDNFDSIYENERIELEGGGDEEKINR